MFDYVIIGAGLAGSVMAERIATHLNKKVLVIEKRNHIGGNCYDFVDDNEILVHKYGPHIFHTNYKEVWDYLSQFTEWEYYQHKVLGFIDGKYVPIPFNLNTLYQIFPEGLASRLEEKLINTFDYNTRVSIFNLIKIEDNDLKFLSDFIYNKIFLHYSEKQWGLKPEEIDHKVIARVPVVISRDDRYFQDKYQGIPKEGYTKILERMLQNKNIEIWFDTDFNNVKDRLSYKVMFYTGPIDEFFDYKFGKLEWRCVNMELITLDIERFQPEAVVNYPNDYDFTRITEFNKFTRKRNQKTTIGVEYPGNEGFVAWPLLDRKNKDVFEQYKREAEKLKKEDIYFLGRLAEYKYYDMDDVVKKALEVFGEKSNDRIDKF